MLADENRSMEFGWKINGIVLFPCDFADCAKLLMVEVFVKGASLCGCSVVDHYCNVVTAQMVWFADCVTR